MIDALPIHCVRVDFSTIKHVRNVFSDCRQVFHLQHIFSEKTLRHSDKTLVAERNVSEFKHSGRQAVEFVTSGNALQKVLAGLSHRPKAGNFAENKFGHHEWIFQPYEMNRRTDLRAIRVLRRCWDDGAVESIDPGQNLRANQYRDGKSFPLDIIAMLQTFFGRLHLRDEHCSGHRKQRTEGGADNGIKFWAAANYEKSKAATNSDTEGVDPQGHPYPSRLVSRQSQHFHLLPPTSRDILP